MITFTVLQKCQGMKKTAKNWLCLSKLRGDCKVEKLRMSLHKFVAACARLCVYFKPSSWGEMWKTQSPPVSMETPSLSQAKRQNCSTFWIRVWIILHRYLRTVDHWHSCLKDSKDRLQWGCIYSGYEEWRTEGCCHDSILIRGIFNLNWNTASYCKLRGRTEAEAVQMVRRSVFALKSTNQRKKGEKKKKETLSDLLFTSRST